MQKVVILTINSDANPHSEYLPNELNGLLDDLKVVEFHQVIINEGKTAVMTFILEGTLVGAPVGLVGPDA